VIAAECLLPTAASRLPMVPLNQNGEFLQRDFLCQRVFFAAVFFGRVAPRTTPKNLA